MLAEQRAELLRAEEVALDLILEVQTPVESDRSRYVSLLVEGGILVDLDDPDRVVVQVLLQPLRLNQYVIGVVSHGVPPSISYRLLSILLVSVYRGPTGPPASALSTPATAADLHAS